ncbi:MAG: glycosyltransferase family 2 protein [Bacteroidetes bacterium]|nr:glycosyltransferase family 2 protein [Bacteroidota bacterium]
MLENNPVISFILINYNSDVFLNNIVREIITKVHKVLFEIVVFENCSTEQQDFSEIEKIGQVRLIKSFKNLGFGRGCNEAVQHAKGDYFIFINPDTEIVNLDLIYLLELIRNKEIGVLGIQHVDSTNSRVISVRPFCGVRQALFELFWLNRLVDWFNSKRIDFSVRNRGYAEVDFVSGAFMLIRKPVFKEMNGFDPFYFMYVEEADFAWRLKKSGYKNIFVPSQVIRHFQGKSVKNYIFELENNHRNQIYFVFKFRGLVSAILFTCIQSLNKAIRGIVYLLFGLLSDSVQNKKKGFAFLQVAKIYWWSKK